MTELLFQDPQKSIPKGTLLAIFISTATYILMVFVSGATVVRDATGQLADALNGSTAFLDCAGKSYPEEKNTHTIDYQLKLKYNPT